jgi:hypothetical protein
VSDRDVPVSEEDEISPTIETAETGSGGLEMTDDDKAKLAELDEQLGKFEAQKRWSDVIKTIIAKAELVVDPGEKVRLYAEAGAM